jgi:alpha-tubulin suppressor-like RCC1 family protein
LKSDGAVVGWVSDPSLQDYREVFTVDGISNAVAIAVGPGAYFTLGMMLLSDGTLKNWGRKFEHPDARPPTGLGNVVAISAGAGQSLALKNDGTVVGWGWNQSGEATGVPTTGRPNLENFSSGAVHLNGELLTNVVSIEAGHGYSMALKKDGTVLAWGKMGDSQRPATVPEGLSNVVAIAAGAEDFCLAITTNKAVADRFATLPLEANTSP